MRRVWIAALGLATGCAWVQLSSGGEGVRVGTAAEVSECEKLGVASVNTRDTVGIFSRNDRAVERELEFMARNEAAFELQGDTVVPRGPESDGRRSYDIYRCR